MNGIQLHFLFNHISLIGIPIVLLFLLIGWIRRNKAIQRTALAVMVGISLAILPAFFTGEAAEEVIEGLPWAQEAQIETHETLAKIAMATTLSLGLLSAIAFLAWDTRQRKALLALIWITSLAATVSLAMTAHTGGQIRHTELSIAVEKTH